MCYNIPISGRNGADTINPYFLQMNATITNDLIEEDLRRRDLKMANRLVKLFVTIANDLIEDELSDQDWELARKLVKRIDTVANNVIEEEAIGEYLSRE